VESLESENNLLRIVVVRKNEEREDEGWVSVGSRVIHVVMVELSYRALQPHRTYISLAAISLMRMIRSNVRNAIQHVGIF
jgi:hypothetical protein